MSRNLVNDACATILTNLSKERQELIRRAADALVRLRLSPEATDALLVALILEAAEAEYRESGTVHNNAPSIDALNQIYVPLQVKKAKN